MPGFMGAYTIFGQVIDGMETLDTILALKTNERDRPLDEITILKIELTYHTE
jgi:cyclophilin family peptidyl-prolyl cis-trans isomerase